MTALATPWEAEQTAGTANNPAAGPVFIVVGFDGSEPARRALDRAVQLLHGREGHLAVVYVASFPSTDGMSAGAVAELKETFADRGRHLSDEVRARLEDTESRWTFHRRDGSVAPELVEAAEELRREHGAEADVVIVVGRSAHQYHRLVRHDGFPVVVVP